jgi:ATP-dependent Lhr-like helicase
LLDESRAYNNWQIELRGDITTPALAEAMREIRSVLHAEPQRLLRRVDERALRTLKFAELLPASLAVSTLSEPTRDHAGALKVSARPAASV